MTCRFNRLNKHIKYLFHLVFIGLFLSPVVGHSVSSIQQVLSDKYKVGDTFMQVRLRGTVRIPFQRIDGFKVTELSALAWDEDEQILYALNDRSTFYHLAVTLDHHRLQTVTVLKALKLLDSKGHPLKPGVRDSEGLFLRKAHNGQAGDTELVISFEGQPRIQRHTPQGPFLGAIPLPAVLRDKAHYRDASKSLESVTEHPQYGVLTAPEWPLKNVGKHRTRVYALSGEFWEWDAYPAPNSAVVALEMLDQQRLWVLERAFSAVWRPLIISLREVQLTPHCMNGQGDCAVQQLFALDNSQGWLIDNFEGLTQHQERFFFMVSDDNESGLQRTLLSYFELLAQ